MKLTVGGRDLTQPLTVRKDPHSEGTEADIQAQMNALFPLRSAMNAGAALLNQIELVRGQIANINDLTRNPAITKATGEFEQKLMALEAGGDDVIAKPYEPAHLVALVKSHLKRAAFLERVSSER